MSKLFENINLIKGFVNNAALNQVQKADSLNQVYKAIADIYPQTVASAQEFQRQDKAFDLEQQKLNQQIEKDNQQLKLSEDELRYAGFKDVMNDSFSNPSYDGEGESGVSITMNPDLFETEVFKEIAAEKNKRVSK